MPANNVIRRALFAKLSLLQILKTQVHVIAETCQMKFSSYALRRANVGSLEYALMGISPTFVVLRNKM